MSVVRFLSGTTALALFALCSVVVFAEEREISVGMRGKIEQLVLTGPELEVKPIAGFETPVIVNITAVYPHGNGFRYDLEYIAMESGRFDLLDFLQRKDGSATEGLEPAPIAVSSVLPEGELTSMNWETEPVRRIGGYKRFAQTMAVLWAVGLALILFWRKWEASSEPELEEGSTFAQRIRSRVEAARSGKLDEEGSAELERMLLHYWEEKLDLQNRDAGEAMRILRDHEEAGPLFHALEKWLHRPESAKPDSLSLDELLEPYREIEETAPVEKIA